MSNTTVPQGWSYAAIGELCTLINGKAFKPSEWTDTGIPIIRIQNLNTPTAKFNHFLGDIATKFIVENGELLFAWSGTPGTSFGAHIWYGGRAVLNQHIFRVLVNETLIEKPFFQLAINHKLQELIDKAQGGVGLRHVTKGKFEHTEILFPPLNEQHRIVAKIEALKARTQRVKEELEAIPALLDQFRQSVLAAAFRGDLTADLREKNPSFIKEWHKNLLMTIRSSVPQTKRQGRLWGSGTSIKEIDETWEKLPDTWNWVKIIDLGYDPDIVVQIGPMSMKSEEFTETGTIVLNVGCVQWDGLHLNKCNYLSREKAAEFERYRICKNDVLFTRSGAVGRSAIVTPEVDGALITFHLLRVRTSPDICLPEYLYFAFRGCKAVKSQIDDSAIGATRAGFNTKLLQNIWIPLPPVEEQAQILKEIKKLLKLADSIRNKIGEDISFLETLDQSILAKAFRGELVPQDPNDEPASVLLERIRAERAKLQAAAIGAKKSNGKAGGRRSRKTKQEDTEPIQLELPGLE